MTTSTDYQQQAIDFANKYGVELEIGMARLGYHFEDDNQKRYIFPCTLTRDGKSYSFEFGQSIADGAKEPTMYDILACMTKNDPYSFEDFCHEYGYDEDSRKAERTYEAVKEEWANVDDLFGDILEELQEISQPLLYNPYRMEG